MKQTTLFPEPPPLSLSTKLASAFDALGYSGTVDALVQEVVALYLADSVPWIVGYSGGKDSTAVLQLVWLALLRVPPERRHKPVHVISTDTLVENPIVAQWASGSLDAMRSAVDEQRLWLAEHSVLCRDCARPESHPEHDTFGSCAFRRQPLIDVHRLTPALTDSFWVLLIGKGYAAPRRKFRWCTDRLKIRPSTAFIQGVVQGHGEAILLLGTRKAESTGRKARMERLESSRVRERLSPNVSQPGSLVYSPIEDWSNDDVWMFLMQHPNPWGWSNKTLLTLYQGATDGGECPLVVDTSTPSCGASRFGCWVCTLVEHDKSMTAMIQNDPDKEWMLPLLELRDALDFRNGEDGDRHLRDYRRIHGRVELMVTNQGPRVIPGPYTQAARAEWLRRLLSAERWVRANGPKEVQDLELVRMEELHEIRRIWVEEKHEVEDLLPKVYEEVRGEPFPGPPMGIPCIATDDLALLRESCGGDDHLYALARDLLAVEHRHRHLTRRAGLYGALDGVLKRYTYASEAEAVEALSSDLTTTNACQSPRAMVTPALQRFAEAADGPGSEIANQVLDDFERAAADD